ncbi:beta-1,3-galactosyltransferase 1-like [Saccostrea echinata]|uniref:beta-1,3-galactosyltransferase 1-like n=1 Tax=Saccostrea echinata TaxID=191078 RepID=UPI002A816E8E|nr:beta-1,3-galactosyltransferase 1-like [Saccostrea echinata]
MIHWRAKTTIGTYLQYGLLVAVIINFILFAVFTLTHRYFKSHAIVIINPFLGTNISLIHVQNFGLDQLRNNNPVQGIGDDRNVQIDRVHNSWSTALMDISAYQRSTPVVLIRNLTCNGCFKYTYDYVIETPGICTNTTELLFLIASATEGFNQRNALRRTWLNFTETQRGFVKYVFLLGLSTKGSVNDMIYEENERNQDIIQGTFLDTYGNLTLKTRMGIKWTVKACATTKYVMKTDDDMWVHVSNTLSILLPKYGRILETHIGGYCMNKEKPHRDPRSKYYIPESLFSKEVFPPFCSGTGYVTSFKVVKKINEIAENVPFFPLEDVYIGLCLEQLNLNTTKIKWFYHYNPKSKHPCWYKTPYVFTVHGLAPERLFEIWDEICQL